jgi:hypothetical protein
MVAAGEFPSPMSAEPRQDTLLSSLAAEYVAELATWTTPKHVQMTAARLAKLPELLARQVRDLRPEVFEHHRQGLLRQGLARATLNTPLVALGGVAALGRGNASHRREPAASLRVLRTGRA